jgi:hypothetical protein
MLAYSASGCDYFAGKPPLAQSALAHQLPKRSHGLRFSGKKML